jgi:phage terminase large subunit GpA-like protein
MRISELAGRALRPPARVPITTWADEHRVLPSSSAEPGRWRSDRTPYMSEIVDCLAPGGTVRTVALMKSAQVGGTEALLNLIGHAMTVYPGPMLVVQPTDNTARSWSDKRLAPMIRATPALDELFGPSKRNPRNKTLYKEFPGGFLRIAYSSSAPQLRSDPIRDVFLDEIDGYPEDVGGEGDPVELAIARTRTFSDRRRVIGVSTPTVTGHSRIERWYNAGDQRKYFLPCPHCRHYFVPELAHLERNEAGGADLKCPDCQTPISESHKTDMLAAGEWRATATATDPTFRSYHLSALYSPAGWFSWADVLDGWEAAQASDDANALRVFYNTILGLTHEARELEQLDWKPLFLRRGNHDRGVVPTGGCVLTAGVDVQGDRIEAEVLAWGRDLRTWSVDYKILRGDVLQPAVWRELARLLDRGWPGEGGAVYTISRLAIDSGFSTQEVYRFAEDAGQVVMPIKGASHTMSALVAAPEPVQIDVAGRKRKSGVRVRRINTISLKDSIKRALELAPVVDGPTPARWCEWPDYPREYFEQLCAEERRESGATVYWEKPSKHTRNEAFDCRVYNLAAAISLGLDRWTDKDWQRAENLAVLASNDGAEIAPIIQKQPAERRYKDSSYLKRRKW